jgi:hypothetical protein
MPVFEIHTVDGQTIQFSHSDATPELLAKSAETAGRINGTEIEMKGQEKREYAISIPWHAISTVRSHDEQAPGCRSNDR